MSTDTKSGLEDKFVKQYKRVFKEYGEVLPCGRDECRHLIELARQIDSINDYGDIESGRMNIKNITNLCIDIEKPFRKSK